MNGYTFEPAAPLVQSSELLGFPPDARVFIVNCDDFGMYDAMHARVATRRFQGWERA
ncbi:hypothetical protein [Streptosporangium sp. CA-115845]|uniref:hypothetical protein n=1 Tax=Streptosporangium sp. CA-115845 TaxID=3240071 RepID=UPI003D8E265C